MSGIALDEVLQAFSSAFKSIDLRIVAVKWGDYWANIITSIFLSPKTIEETRFEQQQVMEKLPKNTNEFCILLDCLPFKSLSNLFEQIDNKELLLYGKSILFRNFNINKLSVDQHHPNYLKEMQEWKVIGSQADTKKDEGMWRIVDSHNGEARLSGFENIYDLIKETLKIRDFDRGKTRALVIGIPMPARIADISFDKESVKIKTKKVSSLDDLQLNISAERVYPGKHYFERFWRTTKLVKKCNPISKRIYCNVTNSIKLANSKPYDRIEVELIHRKVPTLSMDKTYLMVPFENAVEPFAKTLNAFCSLDVFKERLLNPERFKKGRTKTNTIFENAVAWLLSIIGFSVLHLGRDFEILRIPESRVQVGSVDIIAYRENEYLLLVDCDISIPDEKKIRSMMVVKDHFEFLQDEHKRPNIISIIISPKDCRGITVGRQDVKLVDRFKIKQMFEEAMRGETEQARYSLIY